jgi:hypothetical protein
VNLLKQWFGRHRSAHQAAPSAVSWVGASGKHYPYHAYPITTSFRAMPGNFIYAKRDEAGTWIPVYIAQTRDLHQRLEGHVLVETAREHGATHIHAHYDTAGQATRCREERDLIERWHPSCNEF